MSYLRKKISIENSENESNILKDVHKKIDLNNRTINILNKELDKNIFDKNNRTNYFNKSSKNCKNIDAINSLQKKICININETKKNFENKNINRINNTNNMKKENIKRIEFFKPEPKNKYFQNIYSNISNTNTNNKNKKCSNNKNSINNSNKQIENKNEKFMDSNTNYTNSCSNPKEIIYESIDLSLFNNNHKINNKRNKNIKIGEVYTLDSLQSINKNDKNNLEKNQKSELESQTYTIPFMNDIIKVNMAKINEKENKNQKYPKNNFNNNNKNPKRLKTFLNNNNLYINTDFNHHIKKKNSFSNVISENNLKLKTNNNIRLFTNSLVKSTKNTINVKIYLPGYNQKKTFIKKKSEKSLNNINNSKGDVMININRSLDLKHKPFYLISSRVNSNRTNKESQINIKDNKTNILLNSERKKIIDPKFRKNSIIMPEYKLKLEAIKSRMFKLLNIYSLIALMSLNNNKNDIQSSNKDENGEIENYK